jgi:hypothetical protein
MGACAGEGSVMHLTDLKLSNECAPDIAVSSLVVDVVDVLVTGVEGGAKAHRVRRRRRWHPLVFRRCEAG